MNIEHIRYAAIERILNKEGGYVNNPNDSGGETNYGITESVARRAGYKGTMKAMPKELAIEIYANRYLDRIKFDDIAKVAPSVAMRLSDVAVNMGVKRAGIFLQTILNVMNNQQQYWADIEEDGIIGDVTVNTLCMYISKRGSHGSKVLCASIFALQLHFYINLAKDRQKDETFLYGWLLRALSEGF